MEQLRAVLSDDDEPKPILSARSRELLGRIITIVTVTLGMALIIWDATNK